jgi:hypothetical protein
MDRHLEGDLQYTRVILPGPCYQAGYILDKVCYATQQYLNNKSMLDHYEFILSLQIVENMVPRALKTIFFTQLILTSLSHNSTWETIVVVHLMTQTLVSVFTPEVQADDSI